jgi:protein-tyrosine phosphatase
MTERIPLPPPRDASPSAPYRVCCVCLGNICRSPMAEVVLRHQLTKGGLADRVIVDSAGTGGWHVGERMNHGARAQLARDPYGGPPAEFAQVLAMLETGMATLVTQLTDLLAAPSSETAD